MGRGSVGRFLNKKNGATRTFRLIPGPDGDTRMLVEVAPRHVQCRPFESSTDQRILDVVTVNDGNGNDDDDDLQVGEAACYGILLDDRHYDYMQHLKRIGEVPGAILIDNGPVPDDYLERLRAVDVDIRELADPAVREVFEALENDAHDDDDGNREDLPDDFVRELDAECSDETCIEVDDLERVLDQLDTSSVDDEDGNIGREQGVDERDLSMIRSQSMTKLACTKEDLARRGFAEVDEMRMALLPDRTTLIVPSDSSEFDSDEYFASSGDEQGRMMEIPGTSGAAAAGAPLHKPRMIDDNDAQQTMTMTMMRMRVSRRTTGAAPIKSTINLGEPRVKDESAEEKKLRKATTKASRRERRCERKEHRLLFK